MATDYILFIHGVSTRDEGFQPSYANELFCLIENKLGNTRKLKSVPIYWGNIGAQGDKIRLFSRYYADLQ